MSPLETRPKRVALVALGKSREQFFEMTSAKGGIKFDEVWAINRASIVYRHDKAFVMDDLKWLEQRDISYAEHLRRHDKPIVTCHAYDDYPTSVAYPLKAVLKMLEDDVLNNTVCYAVAYAMLTQVRELFLFGCDFFSPEAGLKGLDGKQAVVEEGAQTVAYLLGLARAMGMVPRIPQTSTLLNMNQMKTDPQSGEMYRPLYGYHRRHDIRPEPPDHPSLREAPAIVPAKMVNGDASHAEDRLFDLRTGQV